MDNDALVALLKQIAAGDRAAFRKLYDATSPKLFAAALNVLRSRDLAEDAVQETFIKIWRSAKTFDPSKGAAMAWMGTIARRCALNRIGPDRPTVALDQVTLSVPAVEVEGPRLNKCLEKLPETHRKALLLMYVYGMSHSELAVHLGAPLGTVKSWVSRAAAALKECLES